MQVEEIVHMAFQDVKLHAVRCPPISTITTSIIINDCICLSLSLAGLQ